MRHFFTIAILAVMCCFLAFKSAPKEVVFLLKKIEKRMALVKPGLHACKFETTNLEYNQFLKELAEKGDTALMEKAKIHEEKWNERPVYYGEPLFCGYSKHPAYGNFPVVNISQVGATLFCEWLTERYNTYSKRKFKHVRFRLPNEQEWLLAARAGKVHAVFACKSQLVNGEHTQLSANFSRVPIQNQKKLREDGTMEIGLMPKEVLYTSHLTAPVESFKPNGFGIYNMSGNAAEMLAEPGRTKGGSWRSLGYYLRLDAEDEYAGFTEPSPMVGFRYFMEVLAE